MSQSAFVRGFIDDTVAFRVAFASSRTSQSAFVRGFIDDAALITFIPAVRASQSAFVRGFIDDDDRRQQAGFPPRRLNPRSCAASSMTV